MVSVVVYNTLWAKSRRLRVKYWRYMKHITVWFIRHTTGMTHLKIGNDIHLLLAVRGDSVIRLKATWLWRLNSIPSRYRDGFLFAKPPTIALRPKTSFSEGTNSSFPQIKHTGCEDEHSLPSSAKINPLALELTFNRWREQNAPINL